MKTETGAASLSNAELEGDYTGIDILEALQGANNYNSYLTGLIRRWSESREVVDFGAGVGTFAKLLRERGFSVLCIEPDGRQRERLREHGFAPVSEIGCLPDQSTSFVFSLNVFEHIQNDADAVAEVASKLRVGGLLLIYVPAFQCLWTSLDDKVCHYRRYTNKTLRALVVNANFRVERLRYADSLGFIAALIFRLFRRNATTLTAPVIRFYDRWLFPVSRVFDFFLGRFVGKNVYVVCRKIGDAGGFSYSERGNRTGRG